MSETKTLYELLIKAKENDEDSIIALCKKFDPLIKKYCNRLYYEDAYYDIKEIFIHIIMKIPIEKEEFKYDKYILSYIKNAIYHSFIQLNKKKENYENYICFLPEEVSFDNILIDNISNDYIKDKLLLIDMENLLTKKQLKIFELKIIQGYSDNDIAKVLQVSRQAVNKQVNKIKPKLKEYLYL